MSSAHRLRLQPDDSCLHIGSRRRQHESDLLGLSPDSAISIDDCVLSSSFCRDKEFSITSLSKTFSQQTLRSPVISPGQSVSQASFTISAPGQRASSPSFNGQRISQPSCTVSAPSFADLTPSRSETGDDSSDVELIDLTGPDTLIDSERELTDSPSGADESHVPFEDYFCDAGSDSDDSLPDLPTCV